MKSNFKKTLYDYAVIFSGCVIFAVSFNLFIKNAHIAVGGISGISLVINYFFPKLSIGVMTLVLNIPFLILGLLKIGGSFMIKTIFASFVLSLSLSATEWLSPITTEPILCTLYGGLGTGVGLGLVFLRDGSTAGSDIVGIVLRRKYPSVPLGKLILATDMVIVLFASIAFRNANSILYAVVYMYVASIATDGVLYGFTTDKLAYIITGASDAITKLIISELGRSATIVTAEGAFTNKQRKMIMCAITPNQIGKLREIVRSCDEKAFMIVTNTHEILGSGFRPNIKSNI
ncbi:MAG: YitT family protein [Oscillospiraceae bacterium]|nr:YitT family protein [Oscillospiraceae bacterium]